MAGSVLTRTLPDETATALFGQDIAMAVRAGDVLALSGDLGAGKTTLARALIRTIMDDDALEVPSPTFTLVQAYAGRLSVSHFDLYRVAQPSDIDELGLDEAAADGVAVIEWPDRAGDRLSSTAVHIDLADAGSGRIATVSGAGPLFERLGRSLAMRRFLERFGRGAASRRFFVGDASARSYEIVMSPPEPPRVLMNAPPLVLGPPVRGGKAYAEIAHTARSVAAFVALDRALAKAGIAVPELLASDIQAGLLLLEHLGETAFLGADGHPVAERYAAAAELLATLHARPWPARLEAEPGVWHDVPPFDRAAMMIEVDLLIDWYIPFKTGAPADAALRDAFGALWNAAFDRLGTAETSLVLRDFHSPNIVWRPEREGLDRMGILDFQDALIGPSAYDVASLAMDARVTVPAAIERSTVEAYVAARRRVGAFDEDAFHEAYAIMAAQRNSKILGIFVRLDRRDGKPAYLRHLPRIRDYLARSFEHPALHGLRDLYHRHSLIDEDAG